MFTNKMTAEFKIGERTYQFICGGDSPTNEVKEVCYQILKYCGQIEDTIKAQKEEEQSSELEEVSTE